MADMEKVEKGLNICTSAEPCNGCPYLGERNCSLAMVRDSLELLREQQNQIWEFQDQVEYLTDKQKEQEEKRAKAYEVLLDLSKITKDIDDTVLSAMDYITSEDKER